MHVTPRTYRRYSCTTLLALFILFFANAQTNVNVEGRKKLTAADFKGVPDEKDDFLAHTYSTISLKYFNPVNCKEKGKVKLNAETGISIGAKSWMKFNRIRSKELLDDLLSHEQGHYDIGQTFVIDLKNRITSICFDKNKYKVQADSVFRSMNRYYDSLQRKYDIDTDHMRNKKAQSAWKSSIAAMLEGKL